MESRENFSYTNAQAWTGKVGLVRILSKYEKSKGSDWICFHFFRFFHFKEERKKKKKKKEEHVAKVVNIMLDPCMLYVV